MADELLTVDEVAERVKVNPETVRRWIKAGRLPAAKPAGGPYRIHSTDLDQLLRGAQEAPKAEAPSPPESEEERRYLVLLLQSYTMRMTELGNRDAARINGLRDDLGYKESLRENQWVAHFLRDCRQISRELGLPHFADAIEPWVAGVDADDATVPKVLREQIYRFQRVRSWLFEEVEPKARDWQRRQREQFPNDAELEQREADILQQQTAEREEQDSAAIHSELAEENRGEGRR